MKEVLKLVGLNKESTFEKLNRNTKIDKETECWEWGGYARTNGKDNKVRYGTLTINKKRGEKLLHAKLRVHRASAWIFLDLDIYDDKQMVCHHCDNPICWNPRHLYLGDAKSNSRDRWLRTGYTKKVPH